MSGWLLLISGLIGLCLVANAARPMSGPWSLMPSWLASFLTVDLAPFHLLLALLLTAAVIGAGALESAVGWLGLAMVSASSIGLVILCLPALRAAATAIAKAEELDLDEAPQRPGDCC